MKKEKVRIGWRENVSLPDLKIKSIKVKVDTGAATSALHAENIEFIKSKSKVKFTVHPLQKSKKSAKTVEADFIEMRKIRSSTGHITERPVVRTRICIGDLIWEIEVTLVNRDIMGFRMLLGRKALKKIFVVDPSRSFLLSKKEIIK